MRTLHAVAVPESAEPEIPTCPCGSQAFTRIQFTRGRERYTLDFGGGGYPNEDWETLDTDDTQDSDPWECRDCGTVCHGDLQDLIDDSR